MKLSETIYHDFLKEDSRPGSIHKVSHGYLIDLRHKIKQLENNISNIQTELHLATQHLHSIADTLNDTL